MTYWVLVQPYNGPAVYRMVEAPTIDSAKAKAKKKQDDYVHSFVVGEGWGWVPPVGNEALA